MKEYIYVLFSRHDHAIRYVGISNDPLRRFKDHIGKRSHSLAVSTWVAWVQRIGSEVVSQSIDEADDHEKALDKEAFWIQYFAKRGSQLLNTQQRILTPERVEEIYSEMIDKFTPENYEYLFREIVDKIIVGRFDDIPMRSLAQIEFWLSIFADNHNRQMAIYSRKGNNDYPNWREGRTLREDRLGIIPWEELRKRGG